MADFNVSSRDDGDVSIIKVLGYLDAHTAPELENEFNRMLDKKRYKIIVNFSELNYISSAGLGVFMAYVETMREHKGDIKFSNLRDAVYSVFDLLGFPVLYEFFKDESEAINKFR
jgi:anti-sigma B factor antagonist